MAICQVQISGQLQTLACDRAHISTYSCNYTNQSHQRAHKRSMCRWFTSWKSLTLYFTPSPPPVLFPGRMRQETEIKRADVSSVLSRMKSNARLHCAWQGHRSLAGSMNARRGMGGPSSDGAVDQRCHLRAYVAKLSSLHTNSNTHKHQQHIVWPVLVCSLRRCAKQGSSARSRVENWVTFLLGFT